MFLAVFKRTFCDEDLALLSCPDDKQLVFHEKPFYGQAKTSESCPATNGKTCTSNIDYGDIDKFCQTSSCEIKPVSHVELDQEECKDSNNYLTLYHSCQESKYCFCILLETHTHFAHWLITNYWWLEKSRNFAPHCDSSPGCINGYRRHTGRGNPALD